VAGSCEDGNCFMSHERRGISSTAERLSASEEEICSMELFNADNPLHPFRFEDCLVVLLIPRLCKCKCMGQANFSALQDSCKFLCSETINTLLQDISV